MFGSRAEWSDVDLSPPRRLEPAVRPTAPTAASLTSLRSTDAVTSSVITKPQTTAGAAGVRAGDHSVDY